MSSLAQISVFNESNMVIAEALEELDWRRTIWISCREDPDS